MSCSHSLPKHLGSNYYKHYLALFTSDDSYLARGNHLRSTLLAFFGLIFVGYWLWTADSSRDGQASFNPDLPSLIRFLPASPLNFLNRRESSAHTSEDLTGIRQWLSTEAGKVGRVEANTSKTVVRLKRKALTLEPAELRVLKNSALSPTASGDERFLAVYIIGLSESAYARDYLKEIANSPVPVTATERAYSDEVVIRATALESAVQKMSPTDSRKYLNDMLAHTQDPSLARHARYWLTRLG